MVCAHAQDPHPRVRWAVCNCLGQLSEDFAGILQKKHHVLVMNSILQCMDDAQPRVQAHAAAAAVNFFDGAGGIKGEELSNYVDPLLSKLVALLNDSRHGRIYLQEQVVSTIATLADSCGERFTMYYDAMMPMLLRLLETAQDREVRQLRGKAIECATLIALAVGKEKFTQTGHAQHLINLLIHLQGCFWQ